MFFKLLLSGKSYWPYISILLLAVVVVATQYFSQQFLILAALMLLLPLIDNNHDAAKFVFVKTNIVLLFVLLMIIFVVIFLKENLLIFFMTTLVFTALPEEWFFRIYLMQRIGRGLEANVIASVLFSALHAITFGWLYSFLVFLPSLVFGWVYQRQQNFVILVLLHAVSNLVYVAYLSQYLDRFS